MTDRDQPTIELRLILVSETEFAYQVTEAADAKPVWVPKSLVSCEGRELGLADVRLNGLGPFKRVIYNFTLPEWMAEEKDLA